MTEENKEQANFDLTFDLTTNHQVDNDQKMQISDDTESKPIVENKPTKAEQPIVPPKPAKKSISPMKILIGGIALTVVAMGITVFVALSGDDDAQRQAMRQMQQQQQMQMQQQEQVQQQTAEVKTPAETMPSAVETNNPTSPANEVVTNEVAAKQIEPTNGVGGEIAQGNTLVFDSKGEIASFESTEGKEKRGKLSKEEILANKDLKTYTEDELYSAYQMVDFELTQITDTQKALVNRMNELGIEPPITQLEARQAIHDKALVDSVVAQLSEKLNQNMVALNKKMDDLNQSQITLSRDVSNSVSNVMQRINIEDINAKRQKDSLSELTKANTGLLAKYQIKQMASGRVWIIDPTTHKATSYTTGDDIGDGIVIQSIDLSNYKITTNKGEIKYNFK